MSYVLGQFMLPYCCELVMWNVGGKEEKIATCLNSIHEVASDYTGREQTCISYNTALNGLDQVGAGLNNTLCWLTKYHGVILLLSFEPAFFSFHARFTFPR